MKTIYVTVFSLCLSVLLPLEAWACSCRRGVPVAKFYEIATVVVLAKATYVPKFPTDGIVRLEVIRSWKSKSPKTITVLTDYKNTCDFSFSSGENHIVYFYIDKAGKFLTSYCSGNVSESEHGYQERIRWLDDFGMK